MGQVRSTFPNAMGGLGERKAVEPSKCIYSLFVFLLSSPGLFFVINIFFYQKNKDLT